MNSATVVHLIPAHRLGAAMVPAGLAAPSPSSACAMCFHRRSCLPDVLGREAEHWMPQLMSGPLRVAKGTRLFRAGQGARHLYVVHTGAFKAVLGLPDGRQRIVGFHEAGDLLGLEAFTGVYRADAVALEHAQVCEIDLQALERAAAHAPALQRHLCHTMASALVQAHGQQFALGSMHVKERLVRFLLSLAQRYKQRGLSHEEFTLRMSREDIGEYLGFRLETVSRVFTELQREGLIELSRRRVRILDQAGLLALLEPDTQDQLRPLLEPVHA